MKTKLRVRRVAGERAILLVLALAVSVIAEFALGEALATRCGQATAVQTETVQAPNLSLGEVLAAIR